MNYIDALSEERKTVKLNEIKIESCSEMFINGC